jgi:ribonucleoside-triphosphate reductase
MRTIAEIDADIAKVKAELEDVHGTTTEVYARIVGYYRSVRNWNQGKREEYRHRKLFVADEGRINAHLPENASFDSEAESCDCAVQPVVRDTIAATAAASDISAASIADHYELYVRKTCPNCPPVKECCTNLPISGEQIDVDQAEGFARASANEVYSTPTAIFFDANGTELARAYSVKEIRAIPALAHTAEAAPALF